MPIYDYTYRTWEGQRRGPLSRWMAIPRFTWMEFFGKRIFIWLFTIAWFQFILRLGYVYLLVNLEFLKALDFPTQNLPSVAAAFFKSTIDVQLGFCFLFAFLMGSGLVSRDMRHSAIVLYASKPISLWEYFAGKFVALFALLMSLTWLQAMLLFVAQAIVAPDNSHWRLYFWRDYAWIPGAITLYSVVVSATLSLMILAASSLTKNGRYAGLTFAAYIIGSGIVAGMVVGIVGVGDAWALSPVRSGVQVGYYLFGLGESFGSMSAMAAWAGVLGVCAMCAAILKWRLTGAARFGR